MEKIIKFSIFVAIIMALIACTSPLLPTCGSTSAPAPHELANTQWNLIRWHQAKDANGLVRLRNISHADQETALSLNFSPDGRIASGFSGCNYYNAEIINDEKGILLEKISVTKKSCSPYTEEIEKRFLSYLEGYRNLIHDGDRLILMARDGEVLSFALRSH